MPSQEGATISARTQVLGDNQAHTGKSSKWMNLCQANQYNIKDLLPKVQKDKDLLSHPAGDRAKSQVFLSPESTSLSPCHNFFT